MGAKLTKGSCAKKMDDEVEYIVCKEDEIGNNEMKEFPLGDDLGRILLVNQRGALSAIGNKCTHYGAPLAKGVLSDGRVRCPWHGACFNAATGDIEDFPGLDSLPCYSVRVDDGQVKVKVDRSKGKVEKRVRPMVRRDKTNSRTIVIVGGGGAGQACVETLRQEGFTGRVVLVTQEAHHPYDRPKLSKALDSTAEKLALRPPDFYTRYDIEVMLGKEATGLDTQSKTLKLRGGEELKYDVLIAASGGRPRSIEGAENAYMLRTPEDGNKIAGEVSGKKIAIVGASFIGMEVAAYLTGKASDITVIGPGDVPFSAIFGKEIGTRLMEWYQEKGVHFRMGARVTGVEKTDGGIKVAIDGGEAVEADLCLVAIGVTPSTDYLAGSGVDLNGRRYVVVDEMLKSNVPDVYAAGDIASFPLFINDGERVQIGHWQMAMAHGRTAALNALGHNRPIKSVPFFWSVMFGKSLRFAGYNVGFQEVVIDGDLKEMKFAAHFLNGDGNLIATATLDRDPLAAKVAQVLASGKEIGKEDLATL